jgi:hypothetical protein
MASHERELIELAADRPFGTQLFILDPVRFLREEGWPVSQSLAAELARRRRTHPEPGRYERIAAGKDPVCRVDLALRKLAIPERME